MSLRVRSYKSFTFGEYKGRPTLEIDSDSWNDHFLFGKTKARLFLANIEAIERHVNDKSYYKPDLNIEHDDTAIVLSPARVRQIYRWRHVITRWTAGGSFESIQLASGLNSNQCEILKESLTKEFFPGFYGHTSSAFRDRSTATHDTEPREVVFVFNEHSGSLYGKVAEMRKFAKMLIRRMPDILDAQSEKTRIQKIHTDAYYARRAQIDSACEYYKQLNMNQTTNQHV